MPQAGALMVGTMEAKSSFANFIKSELKI